MGDAILYRPDRSYVITGGLGGFGLAVAEYMGQHGAKNLVITSKRGVRNGAQSAALQLLSARDVKVRTASIRLLL